VLSRLLNFNNLLFKKTEEADAEVESPTFSQAELQELRSVQIYNILKKIDQEEPSDIQAGALQVLTELPEDELDIQQFLASSACVDHLKLNLQTGCETTRKNTLTLISQLVEKYAKDQKKADNINLYRHKLPLDEETNG